MFVISENRSLRVQQILTEIGVSFGCGGKLHRE